MRMRKKRTNKKVISLYLLIIVLFTVGITAINSFASGVYIDGFWNSKNVTLHDTSDAELMVRVGDIDNFGFGWPSGFDPFTGNEAPISSYEFRPQADDPKGTDKILAATGFLYNYSSIIRWVNSDLYTMYTNKFTNIAESINMEYSLNNIIVKNAIIQMFVNDFQPGNKIIKEGTVKYVVTINDQEIPELSDMINTLEQVGYIGRLLTFKIPERYLDLVRTGRISIKIDDARWDCTGDGYAIDFVKLLINNTGFENTATISGKVTDSTNGKSIKDAKVSAGGVVETFTDINGNYTLNNVPAGQAVVIASKGGYKPERDTEKMVVKGGVYNGHDFKLTPAPSKPIIDITPKTFTKGNITANINYSDDSNIKEYRINIGRTMGEWKIYSGEFEVTENCVIEAQGINEFGNESEIGEYRVTKIDRTPPSLPYIEGYNYDFRTDSDHEFIIYPGEDSGSGVKEVQYKIWPIEEGPYDEPQWKIYNNVFKVDVLHFRIKAKTIDNVGNESEIMTQEYYFQTRAKLTLLKEINSNIGDNRVEIKYKITPSDISIYDFKYDLDNIWWQVIPDFPVSDMQFNEDLRDGLTFISSDDKMTISTSGSKINGRLNQNITYKIYIPKDSNGNDDFNNARFRAEPIEFSIWLKGESGKIYNMLGQDSYLTYLDVFRTDTLANFNDLEFKINSYSNILSHGIYTGNSVNPIKENDLNVVTKMPTQLAMMIGINTSNPVINLNIMDKTKILEQQIVLKKYDVSDGNFNIKTKTPQSTTLDVNSCEIKNTSDFSLEKDKKYIILYTITPIGNENDTIRISPTIDAKETKTLNLNIKDLIDLF